MHHLSLRWLVLAGACAGHLLVPCVGAQPPPPGGQGHYLLGTEEGGNTAIFNRFQWWDKVPPPDGPITGAFESEFCPPLARLVGDPLGAPPGFAVTSWVASPSMFVLAKSVEFATRYDYPRSHPEITPIVPGPARPQVTILLNRYYGPLPLVLTGDNFRPALWLDFERPQRAVGLEFGFVPLPDGNRPDMDGNAVHLIAYDKSGNQIAESRGGSISIARSNLGNRIGVRRARGDIWSVKLLFERGSGANIQDQQALLRVWHEPLPPAAVKQGAVSAAGFNPGGLRQGPVSVTRLQTTLPFNCDRAMILLRGFWLKYADRQAHHTGTISVNFGLGSLVRQTTPGGSVSWAPAAEMRPFQTPPPGVEALLYYSILAWDSQQTELFTATVSGGANAEDPYAASLDLTVADPTVGTPGWGTSGVSPTWRAQTEALRGQLFGALGGFGFSAGVEHDDIAALGMSVGAYQWLGGKELYWTPDTAGPNPVLRNLRWPSSAYFIGDGSANYGASLAGALLTGRSLRAAADAAAAPEYSSAWTSNGPFLIFSPPVTARPSLAQGSPAYWSQGWRNIRAARQSYPLAGEVAVVGLREFAFYPGDPIREIEAEIHGANYDGRTVDWQQGRGIITNDADAYNVTVLPVFASVRRNADFARPRLEFTRAAEVEATFAKPWEPGGSTSLQSASVRNSGEADVLIDRIIAATNAPVDRRFSLRGVVWRGETLTVDGFGARHPLQLRPSEELQVLLAYTADPAWPRNSPAIQETGSVLVLTNDPNVTATLSGTAFVHADFPRGSVEAEAPNGALTASYDFGRVTESTGTQLSVPARVTDLGGTPLTVSSLTFRTPGVGFEAVPVGALSPQPVPGQPSLPPRASYKVVYTFAKRFGVQTNEFWVETNAGRLKLKLRIEVVP